MKLLKILIYHRNISFNCRRLFCSGNRITRPTMETVRVSLLLRIPEISKANVKIPNPELVCDKLRKMSEQNKGTLQIVTDFDLTLTKPTVNGKPAVGSLEIFKIMEETPDELIKCGREMMREYYKVIKDPSLSMDQRIEMTDKILAKFEKSLGEIPIPDDTAFVREASKGIFVLREGTAEAFKMLKDSSVPVLVLSGGLACIINYVLKEQGILDSNVHVMANSYKYKDGTIASFDGDVVHFFNKNLCYLKSEIYKKELSKRPNIILLGDSASDATMTDGVPDDFNVLKIGFYHSNLMPELSMTNVIIPNPELVYDKLKKMSEQSNETLQVVADFDSTLTKPTINGKPSVGSLEVFTVMDIVPKEFITKCRAKAMEFFMGQRNPKLTLDNRIEMSDELVTFILERLKSLPIPDDSLFLNEAAKGIFVLRDGTHEAFKMLKEKSVPVLVLSGGLACIINYVLKDQGLSDSNVHVLATSYKYKDGHIDSFDGDVVHFFNKNICYLKSEIYKKELSKKNNVIIMGDALADSMMVDGVPETFNVLKIGFCHKNLFGQGPEEYAKKFDIVVTEDETMHLVNAILKYVLSPS